MDSTNRPVHININDKTLEGQSKSTVPNNYRDYIINTNQKLDEENKEFRIQIESLNNTISNNEDEIDKMENRIRYMKGLLQNMNEMKKLAFSILDTKNVLYLEYKKMSQRCRQIDISVSNFFVYYFWSLWLIWLIDTCIMFSIFGISYNQYFKTFIYHSLPFIGLVIFYTVVLKDEKISADFLLQKKTTGFFQSFKNNLNKLNNTEFEKEQELKEKMIELKKIEEGCIGISEMIDHL